MSKKTTCKKCGAEIIYVTKPPLRCDKCKLSKQSKRKTRPRLPKKRNTKGELYLFAVLDKILPKEPYINHGYYSSLPSPKGAPMQLDRYYPELKLAFEYDGSQHESFNEFLHKTVENFNYMQKCDKLKDKHCKEQGITLIRVHYKHKITNDSIKIDIKKANEKLYNKLFK